MSEEESKGHPKNIFNANILGSYKQATLQWDHTTCLSTTPRKSSCMWAGLWEGIVSVGKWRITRAPRAVLALPTPAQGSPALPQPGVPCQPLPKWCCSRAGLQLPTALPGPGPLQTSPTSWAGAVQGHPNAPSPQGAAFFCSLTLQVCLSSPAWLSSSLGWHSEGTQSLAAQTRGNWLQSQKRQDGGACRYQKLHCSHKYGNTMPKNNLNSTPLYLWLTPHLNFTATELFWLILYWLNKRFLIQERTSSWQFHNSVIPLFVGSCGIRIFSLKAHLL